ncbi:hypothetical protein ACPW96_21720 [Micromonospora sp. DT81.3]|uniref:hypothetical protein n=1 Tax=Micromonospora sp. DT81.3 TaxID=3416523 RepID=UPI003CF2BFFF
MSLTQFTLGARLRAADTGEPVAISVYAPAIPPLGGIAVTVDSDGDHIYLNATDGNVTRAGTDRDGLDALAALGATLTSPRRPLIVGAARDLAVLTALARAYPDTLASPVVGWWDERSDYPGTDAVHIATDAARRRWVLGVHPDLELDTATWAQWLGIASTGPHLLLDLARRTASGHTLPGLLGASVIDTASWERYNARLKAGRPWWAKDSRSDAALGLIGRSHAAEWFDSIRLDDPLVAVAASHDGTVIPGTVRARKEGVAVIEADRPLSRLRVDSKIIGWLGEPIHAGRVEALSGTVTTARIDTHSRLTITIEGIPKRATACKPGERVTLRPQRVDPHMQASARRLAATGYHRDSNWIAGRGKPVARRGDVPLDVIVAAAED